MVNCNNFSESSFLKVVNQVKNIGYDVITKYHGITARFIDVTMHFFVYKELSFLCT